MEHKLDRHNNYTALISLDPNTLVKFIHSTGDEVKQTFTDASDF